MPQKTLTNFLAEIKDIQGEREEILILRDLGVEDYEISYVLNLKEKQESS